MAIVPSGRSTPPTGEQNQSAPLSMKSFCSRLPVWCSWHPMWIPRAQHEEHSRNSLSPYSSVKSSSPQCIQKLSKSYQGRTFASIAATWAFPPNEGLAPKARQPDTILRT